MKLSMIKFMEFSEANPETSAEAFQISKGEFELYCRIMDFGMNVFMRTEMACMDREMAEIGVMNLNLDSIINLDSSEAESEMYKAEHDMGMDKKVNGLQDDMEKEDFFGLQADVKTFEKDLFMEEHGMETDKPYEFAAMKETLAELETKRKIDEHPISKLFAELIGKNMGIWL